MMRIVALLTCLLLLPCLCSDEVHLSDGRVLSGEVLSNPKDGKLKFKVIVGSMSMVMEIPRHKIVKLKEGKTKDQIALAKVEQARSDLGSSPSADQIWALALELKALKQTLLFKQYARDVVAIDATHTDANKALGHVQHDGKWMTVRDMHLAKGEVYFEGKWMSKESMDTILGDREAQRLAAAEKRAERMEARRAERDRQRANAFTAIQYRPTLEYGGVRLYHTSPTCIGLPSSGYRYGHSHSHGHSGLSFSASGSSGSTSWSFNYK